MTDKILGMSGTRSITKEQGDAILVKKRRYLAGFNGFVTGGCRGWDAIAGEWLVLQFPDKSHLVVVPSTLTQVDPWWNKPEMRELRMAGKLGNLKIVHMPKGSTYRDRNYEIVTNSDALFYCAEHPEEAGGSTRSGTWQTVRIARRRHKTPPDGVILSQT